MRKPVFAYAKTKTQISFVVGAKLISPFVIAIRIVQSLYFLHLKFQASSHLLWRYYVICIRCVISLIFAAWLAKLVRYVSSLYSTKTGYNLCSSHIYFPQVLREECLWCLYNMVSLLAWQVLMLLVLI